MPGMGLVKISSLVLENKKGSYFSCLFYLVLTPNLLNLTKESPNKAAAATTKKSRRA
jgi:hypothetical protein